MQIVLTGASGFVGSHILRQLARQHELTVIGRQPAPLPGMLPFVRRYFAADLSVAVPALEADVCIHVAGLATDKGAYSELHAANVLATKNVFQAVRCRHFIHISSASVYNDTHGLHRESDDIHPDALPDYGKTKRLAELYLLEQAAVSDASVTILRPRAVYGQGDRVILPRMLQFGQRGRIVVPGDLQVHLSMTHVQNLTDAVALLLDRPASGVRVLNITDQEPYVLREVMTHIIAAVYGKTMPVLSLPAQPLYLLAGALETLGLHAPITRQAIRYITRDTVLDITGIQSALGYAPRYDFFQSMPDLVAWVRRVGLEKVLAASASLPWEE